MIRLTKQIKRIFKENPLHSKEHAGQSAKVIARFSMKKCNIQWLITEAIYTNDNWILHGYVYVNSWYSTLIPFSEIQNLSKNYDILLETYEFKDQLPLSDFML